MLVAILLAVIGVLCGMAPLFCARRNFVGIDPKHFNGRSIFAMWELLLGETLKMLFNTVSSLKAHRVAIIS